ncbi:MAG: GHKL domain-containing protein [bacterium]|nr:GHKL domain-containing protein [bacterium]
MNFRNTSIPPLAVKPATATTPIHRKEPPAEEMCFPRSMRRSFFRFVRHTLQNSYATLNMSPLSGLTDQDRERFRGFMKQLDDDNDEILQRDAVSELLALFTRIECEYLLKRYESIVDEEEEQFFSKKLNASLIQLKKLANIIDGKPHILVPEEVDLERLLGDILPLIGPVSYRYGASSDILLHADKLDMFLLFENLLSNSKRACERRGLEPDIEIISFPSDDYPGMVEISVKDNGIGFTPGELIHANERRRFTSKKEDGEVHGIGLGHCRFIVHLHGGWISIESAVNHGSDITLTLPLLEK